MLQHDGLQQEEADAVAALLAAASGLSSEDMNASNQYPADLGEHTLPDTFPAGVCL